MRSCLSIAILLLAACPKKGTHPPATGEDAAPPEEATEPTPDGAAPAGDAGAALPAVVHDGLADLKLTGAFEKEVKGPVVTCGYTDVGGKPQGGSWKVGDDTYSFTMAAFDEAGMAKPTVILDVKQPARASYTWRGEGTATLMADRTVAEIDTDLKAIIGNKVVHVKGTMTCPALVR